MTEPLVVVRSLVKSFGPVRAVDGLDLTVFPGEILGLLGPNGAGKTTTIRVLVTLVAPDAGQVTVAGHDVSRSPRDVRRAIGYVRQEISVDPYLSARENLWVYGRLFHIPGPTLKSRIEELLTLVELSDRANERVRQFSGGMKKRLDIACGLMHRPRLLILDEPTLGVDVQTRHRIWDYVRLLWEREGITVLLATNYLDEADRLSSRVVIVDRGKVVASGTPEALKAEVGGDVISVRLASESSGEGLLERLRAMPQVGHAFIAGGQIHIHASHSEKLIPEIMRAAADLRVAIEELAYRKPSLDEVFLQHTGRQLREG
jgi:ABC-2 type transport system ATP-binding protein